MLSQAGELTPDGDRLKLKINYHFGPRFKYLWPSKLPTIGRAFEIH